VRHLVESCEKSRRPKILQAWLLPKQLANNIFNTANFSNPTGDLRSTDFLVLTALRGGNGQPRAAQFSMRLGF
jgi:hypothetical protein